MNTFHVIAAIAAALALAATPTLAQEGQGNPFPNAAWGTTTVVQTQLADQGSEAYPNLAGRPGSGGHATMRRKPAVGEIVDR